MVVAAGALPLFAFAQPSYDSWSDVTPAAVNVAPAAVLSSSLTKLPTPGKSVTASYAGTATANFGYTVPTGSSSGFRTYYSGNATAIGTANFKATASASGASFTGTLGNWRPGAAQAGQPAGFNSNALQILPGPVNLTGTIGASTVKVVGYQRSVSGGTQAVSSSSTVGARTRDYLPTTLNGSINLNNSREYAVDGMRYQSNVNYKWTTTRR